MGIVLIILGGILVLAGAAAWLIILVQAFQNEIWKGIVGLICGFYLLYFAIAEMVHPNKWLLIAVWLLAPIVGQFLLGAGGLSLVPAAPQTPAGM
ncbi:MAG: hypothetical protein ACK47B_03085 [Armatimonadota bacterium]